MRAVVLIIIGCSVLTARSQIVFDDGKPPTKQRSPELEELNFMTGKWKSEFILHETPESKEFRGQSIGVTQWSPNGQFLISDGWTLVPGTSGVILNIWGNWVSITTWDSVHKEYRVTEVMANKTETAVMTMNQKGGTVRSEIHNGGHVTKTTVIFERISDTEMKVRTECSRDDGPLWVFLEGTARKVAD